ncbi:MAG: fused MFS/spermidine synthase [Desulfitobacteriaceae bacterium]|nr:fused MFS/spermidine synthase [Desulfitobacteriaceae bacterium]MDI6877794.1 fused MFS/spermidine synthase [Desulfitobacteriaceae bacterium]MDI6912867.1 fused MFS/spermidine synthase [Desulfitobacteriaceae bacterium]
MSPRFLYLYVFLTGAAVMGIEMAASRLIAPYFGTSLMVWANIIGIILLAMSAGYFVGGRLADKRPEPRILFTLSLSAGIILTAIPFVSQWLFHFLTGGILATPVRTVLLAFAGTLLVFSPPIFLLAMVSPYAIRLSTPSAADAGKIAGRLYAFSTLGSLLGTFAPSFWLIPTIGTRATLFLSAFIIMALSAWGLKRWWAVVLALLPLLLLWFAPQSVKGAQVLWEKETPYQYVQVIKQADQSTALVYNEGGGIQSIARPHHGLAPQDYYDYYLVLPFLRKEPNPKAWILGSAGGTMLGLFEHWVRPTIPDLTLTGVEIDPDVIPLGQKYFGLTGSEGPVVNADARTFLHTRSDQADLIVVDAYTQQIYIPFHLSTQEFYQDVKTHLTPGGILALNINAISPSSRLLRSFQHTLATVFPYTYILPVPDSLNYVLLAASQPINLTQAEDKIPLELSPFYQAYRENLKPASTQEGLILTDDKAPVEFLTDQMIWQTLLQTVSSHSEETNLPSSSSASSTTFPNPTVSAPPPAATVSPTPSPLNPTGPAPSTTDTAQALSLSDQGLKQYYARDYPAALSRFNQALALDPACYQALNGKGATYAFQGRYAEGIALIEQAIQLNPSFAYAHFNLGLANELAGRWDAGIKAYLDAIHLDAKDPWSYYGIASIYGRQGNVDKVLEYLQQAIALDPVVKEVARTEQDFAPVQKDSRFQSLVKP